MLDNFTSTDYQKIQKNFLDELVRASKNQPSSISYFKHLFPKQSLIKSLLQRTTTERQIVQAFVIGGTNFEIGIGRITKDGTIKEIRKNRISGTIPQLNNANIFLTFMKKHIQKETKAISINFAYPLDPKHGKFGEVDGILRKGTKEHVFQGLVGKPVGNFIRNSLNLNIPITVVNDTVCLGKNGLVVGTGVNICVNNVNLEAGNFNCFPSTPEFEDIDKKSAKPGGYQFEKFIAGTYLPDHFNLLAKKNNINTRVKDGKDLTKIAEIDNGPVGEISRILFKRSASLVACALAASYQFINKKTLTFTTEGSLFWKGWQFETHVKKQLEELGIPKGAIRFKKVEDSSMQGALNLLTRTS